MEGSDARVGDSSFPSGLVRGYSGEGQIGAKVVSHVRYTLFQLAEVAVSKESFAAIFGKMHGFRGS